MMPSLQQINHRYLHFPAWLGIMAILMLFIAPVVSKSLVSAGVMHSMMPGMSMPGMEMSSMDMSADEMPAPHDTEKVGLAGGHHAMPSHEMGPGMMIGEMSDAACGYCVLLVHLPLLHMLVLALLWSSDIQGDAPPSSITAHFVPSLFYSDAQPRAPPVSQ